MIRLKVANVITQPDYCLFVTILTECLLKGTIKFYKIHRNV